MRESAYVDEYLRGNARRGYGKGLTVQSFFAYELRGKAKSYSGGYVRALERALERRVRSGAAVKGTSHHRAVAYYPSSMFDRSALGRDRSRRRY